MVFNDLIRMFHNNMCVLVSLYACISISERERDLSIYNLPSRLNDEHMSKSVKHQTDNKNREL